MAEVSYRSHHHGGSFFGFFLILIGLIFLLNSLGYLSLNAWNLIWRFWPILLIIWGSRILLGQTRLGYIMANFLSLVLILVLVSLILIASNPQLQNYLQAQLPWLPNSIYLYLSSPTNY